MFSNKLRGRFAPGFTLVELLVVVSIIALLIAILLPSLKRARESAKRLKSMANLRGVSQAGLTYAADDKQEFAIPIGIGDGDPNRTEAYYSYIGFGGKSGAGIEHDPNVSIWGGNNRMGSIHRPLNFVIYKSGFGGGKAGGSASGRGSTGTLDWAEDAKLDLDVFHCPADKGFPGMHEKGWKDSQLSGYDYYGTSYAANPYLVGSPGLNSPLKSNSIYMRPMSRVPNPTNTVLFWEYAARSAVFANNDRLRGGEYAQSEVSGCYWPWGIGDMIAHGHHGQDFHFNVSFGDGHALWIKIKGHGAVDIGRDLMPDGCKQGECKCIFQRGLGWQVDTLPAPLIPVKKLRTDSNPTLIADKPGSGSLFDIVQ